MAQHRVSIGDRRRDSAAVKISYLADKQPVQFGHHRIIIDNQHIEHGWFPRVAGSQPASREMSDHNDERLYAV